MVFSLCTSIVGASKAGQLTSGVCKLLMAVIVCNDKAKVYPLITAGKSRLGCFDGLNFVSKNVKTLLDKGSRE